MTSPEFPLRISREHAQIDGNLETRPVVSTHRGFTPNESLEQPPIEHAQGVAYYEESEG